MSKGFSKQVKSCHFTMFTFNILNVKPNQRENNLEQLSEKKRARKGRGRDTPHTFFFSGF